MLMAFTPLGLFDLLARDARGTAVQGAAGLLSARWLSVRNGIAGRKCHIDSPIVLSLFRTLAHGQVLLRVIKTQSISSGSVARYGTVLSLPRFRCADLARSETGPCGSFSSKRTERAYAISFLQRHLLLDAYGGAWRQGQ
jgi:hypothetical protein